MVKAKRFLWWFLMAAFWFGFVRAMPDTTTVNFNVVTPGGVNVTSGTVMATLSSAGEAPDGGGTSVVVSRVIATISGAGAVSIALVPNDVITPADTYYIFHYDVRSPVLASWNEKRRVVSSPDPAALADAPLVESPPGTSAPISQIQNEGSAMTKRTKLNFVGAGADCVDNPTLSRTDCTFSGGGGAGNPGGSNQDIQVNQSSAFGNAPGFKADTTTGAVKTKILNAERYATGFATSGTGVAGSCWVTSGSNPIQAALNDCPSTGCDIKLDAGCYDLGSGAVGVQIPILSGTLDKRGYRFLGAGRDVTTVNYSGTGSAFNYAGDPFQSNQMVFSGFALKQTGTPRTGVGFNMTRLSESLFSELNVGTARMDRQTGEAQNGFAKGIYLIGPSGEANDFNRIDSCYFKGNTLSVFIENQGDNTVVSRCSFEPDVHDAAASANQDGLHIRNSRGVTVTGNHFNYFGKSGGTPAFGGLKISGVFDGVNIVGNYFEANKPTNITIANEAASRGVNIEGNSISYSAITNSTGIQCGTPGMSTTLRGLNITGNGFYLLDSAVSNIGIRYETNVDAYQDNTNAFDNISGTALNRSYATSAIARGITLNGWTDNNVRPFIYLRDTTQNQGRIYLENTSTSNEASPQIQFKPVGRGSGPSGALYVDSGGALTFLDNSGAGMAVISQATAAGIPAGSVIAGGLQTAAGTSAYGGQGIVSEGATADTFEGNINFPDWSGADSTYSFPNPGTSGKVLGLVSSSAGAIGFTDVSGTAAEANAAVSDTDFLTVDGTAQTLSAPKTVTTTAGGLSLIGTTATQLTTGYDTGNTLGIATASTGNNTLTLTQSSRSASTQMFTLQPSASPAMSGADSSVFQVNDLSGRQRLWAGRSTGANAANHAVRIGFDSANYVQWFGGIAAATTMTVSAVGIPSITTTAPVLFTSATSSKFTQGLTFGSGSNADFTLETYDHASTDPTRTWTENSTSSMPGSIMSFNNMKIALDPTGVDSMKGLYWPVTTPFATNIFQGTTGTNFNSHLDNIHCLTYNKSICGGPRVNTSTYAVEDNWEYSYDSTGSPTYNIEENVNFMSAAGNTWRPFAFGLDTTANSNDGKAVWAFVPNDIGNGENQIMRLDWPHVNLNFNAANDACGDSGVCAVMRTSTYDPGTTRYGIKSYVWSDVTSSRSLSAVSTILDFSTASVATEEVAGFEIPQPVAPGGSGGTQSTVNIMDGIHIRDLGLNRTGFTSGSAIRIDSQTGSTDKGNIQFVGTGYNHGHLLLGSTHLWEQAAGMLRMRGPTPSADNDGNGIVQSSSTSSTPVIAKCGNVSVDPPSISTVSTGTATASVTGLAANDVCTCAARTDFNDDLIEKDCFGTSGTLNLRLYNPTVGSIDAGAQTVDYCCFSKP